MVDPRGGAFGGLPECDHAHIAAHAVTDDHAVAVALTVSIAIAIALALAVTHGPPRCRMCADVGGLYSPDRCGTKLSGNCAWAVSGWRQYSTG